MSTTNTRSNPPATIRVATTTDPLEDNVVHPFSTNAPETAAFGREHPDASPDIDRVIRGFQHELDTLSRSFDRLASSHKQTKRALASAEKLPTTTPINNFQHTTYRTPRDASTLYTGKSHKSDTTKKTNLDDTFFTHATTRSEELPRPVDTPVVSLSGKSSSQQLQKLNERLNEQSYTIFQLQRENNELRKQLLLAQGASTPYTPKQQRHPMYDGSNRPRTTTDHRYDRTYYRPAEKHPGYDEMRPTVSSLSTFPRDEDENTLDTAPPRGFTPGTRFVSELTKFMTIHQGHNVPLSVIIDRHWDKLKYHMREDSNEY